MAGPYTCYNSPPLAGKDELAKEAHTKGSGTLTSTSAAFRAPIPTSASAPAPTLSSLGRYKDL